jgi:hypothetical protein
MTFSIGHASTLSGASSGTSPSSLGFEESVSGASPVLGQGLIASRQRESASPADPT